MDIKLDAEAVQSIAATAIFQSLDVEAREKVVQQAIQALLVPEKGPTWSSAPGQSPLQRAFDQAISQAAQRVVFEQIEKDPAIREGIKKLIGPMLTAALDVQAENYDYSLSTHIGQAVGQWLVEKSREERH